MILRWNTTLVLVILLFQTVLGAPKLLNFFYPEVSQNFGSSGLSKSAVSTTLPTTTTTDDTPDFNRNKVQLDINDNLFASTIPLVMSVFQTIGDFMMSTARRTAEFALLLQPLIGKNLKIEIPTETPRPDE